ncbi:DeoR/GlpR family DNA-binding transcription regulator [Aldersonia sp. NBC_00410]|uniref:DeoR/GlpR family DNA-binding transcription regulator n=1 Tax=Aldersonia sp. NBC_00410 TaxID=2975954 RepID=UPI0022502043|nr:DeoR/GlpR family DNA-binding transcription regulator [Aldersonia sp. NBC_00410]MCX5045928.1 DeoR/GlpR family DNA-binding transcription regulator [Aldersonia sp. NBC_00410]
MYAEERQQAIAALIAQRGRMAVAQLSDLYGVTTETVRRDLAVLEKAGLIRRVHGGAIPAGTLTIELGTAEREHSRAEEKDRIGKAALEYLPDTGGSVLIDAGTTTDRAASYLPTDRDLLVVTNSIPIASRVSALGGVRLHMLGGRVRGVTLATVGDEALRVLETLRVDVALVGTNGITARHGLSTPDNDEAAVKRAIVSAARRVVVVADSTKVGREDLVSFAPLDLVDTIITDTDLNPADRDELLGAGVEVVAA